MGVITLKWSPNFWPFVKIIHRLAPLTKGSWYGALNMTGTLILSCLIQYISRNMHTVFALLCFVVIIQWLIFPYPSGLLHWHCGNLTIAPVPVKQPWWIWINTSFEFIMNDCITTTKQSTTKPCAYFLGYTVCPNGLIEPIHYDEHSFPYCVYRCYSGVVKTAMKRPVMPRVVHNAATRRPLGKR